MVRNDVRDELVSLEQAARVYGVVLDPETLDVDKAATLAQRQSLRAARLEGADSAGDQCRLPKGVGDPPH